MNAAAFEPSIEGSGDTWHLVSALGGTVARTRSRTFITLVFAAALGLIGPGPAVRCAHGQWIGAGTGGNTATDPSDPTTQWNNPSNWKSGKVPSGTDASLPLSNSGHVNATDVSSKTIYVDGSTTDGALYMNDSPNPSLLTWLFLGYSLNGQAVQTGGRWNASVLHLGNKAGSNGTFTLLGGELTTASCVIGSGGTGKVVQGGGMYQVSGTVKVGDANAGNGTNELSGGTLTADSELVGTLPSNSYVGGTGTFKQTGGTNTARYVIVKEGCRYELTGGTLNVTQMDLFGTLDFGNGDATLSGSGAIVNLAGGTVLNTSNATLTIGPNSLLVVPQGMDPATAFHEYHNAGTLHVAGQPFVVGPTETFSLTGGIDEVVQVRGSIAMASGKSLNLNKGLILDGGTVDLGSGNLTIKAPGSAINGGSAKVQQLNMTSGGSLALGGGSLTSAWGGVLGKDGPASVVQTGGAFTSPGVTTLSGGSTYELRDGTMTMGQKAVYTYDDGVVVGGGSTFTQSGGVHTLVGTLGVGRGTGSVGTYVMSGGELNCQEMISLGDKTLIWEGGSGQVLAAALAAAPALSKTLAAAQWTPIPGGTGFFTQNGGKVSAAGLYVAGFSIGRGQGYYTLSAGELHVDGETVGSYGTGIFEQTGGSHTITGMLRMGGQCSATGTYLLFAGDLSVGSEEHVGEGVTSSGSPGDTPPVAVFRQTGGTHRVPKLYLGYYQVASATFELEGGQLSTDAEYLGFGATYNGHIYDSNAGYFRQSGGTHTTGYLWVSKNSRYDLTGGSLTVTGNMDAEGAFDLSGSHASMEVRGTLTLKGTAIFAASDGAEIHMTGSAFNNNSADELALAGLANLRMIFEGGADHYATFEVAGVDKGADAAGFTDNFATGSLAVGGIKPADLRLVDLFDNGNRSSAEALYVHDLAIGPGSTLRMYGVNLFYDGTFVNEGAVLGGMPVFVPEPTTLAFLAVGLIVVTHRRCGRKRVGRFARL